MRHLQPAYERRTLEHTKTLSDGGDCKNKQMAMLRGEV